MTHRCRHAANLAVAAFLQRQFQPAVRNIPPDADRWLARPQCRRLDATCAGGPGHAVTQLHAASQGFEGGGIWQSFDLGPVTLGRAVPRIAETRLQCAVVGQEHQALAVVIQAAGRVDGRHRDEVSQHRSRTRRAELADDIAGLVEEQQSCRGRGLIWHYWEIP